MDSNFFSICGGKIVYTGRASILTGIAFSYSLIENELLTIGWNPMLIGGICS